MTELEEKILEEIKKNNKITRKELAEILQVGVDTIKEYIRNLKRKGALSREGGNMQSGRWRIIE